MSGRFSHHKPPDLLLQVRLSKSEAFAPVLNADMGLLRAIRPSRGAMTFRFPLSQDPSNGGARVKRFHDPISFDKHEVMLAWQQRCIVLTGLVSVGVVEINLELCHLSISLLGLERPHSSEWCYS